MSVHTPGPWVFSDVHDGFLVAGGVPRRTVCLLYNAPGDALTEEQRADARLIAAAPDLLAALMIFRGYFNEWGTPVPGTRTAAVFEQAHAAIAMATGEAAP